MAIEHLHVYNTPPLAYLELIAKNCSEALSTYLFLWSKKGKNNRLQLTKDDISLRMHPNKFHSDMRKLNNEMLISFAPSRGFIYVEMVDWEDVVEAME
jgi:hypothetical protein